MLRGVFQGGECVELLYPRGKDSLKGWKAHDRVSREFDAGTKGFVVSITGGPTARLEAPDAPRSNIGAVQRFLCLQLLIDVGQSMSVELMLSDSEGGRMRALLSSATQRPEVNPLHVKLPLDCPRPLPRGSWVNLLIDMNNIAAVLPHKPGFRSLDGIVLHASCKVRAVFTLRSLPPGCCGVGEGYDGALTAPIPRAVDFPPGVPHSAHLHRTDVPKAPVAAAGSGTPRLKPVVAPRRPSDASESTPKRGPVARRPSDATEATPKPQAPLLRRGTPSTESTPKPRSAASSSARINLSGQEEAVARRVTVSRGTGPDPISSSSPVSRVRTSPLRARVSSADTSPRRALQSSPPSLPSPTRPASRDVGLRTSITSPPMRSSRVISASHEKSVILSSPPRTDRVQSPQSSKLVNASRHSNARPRSTASSSSSGSDGMGFLVSALNSGGDVDLHCDSRDSEDDVASANSIDSLIEPAQMRLSGTLPPPLPSHRMAESAMGLSRRLSPQPQENRNPWEDDEWPNSDDGGDGDEGRSLGSRSDMGASASSSGVDRAGHDGAMSEHSFGSNLGDLLRDLEAEGDELVLAAGSASQSEEGSNQSAVESVVEDEVEDDGSIGDVFITASHPMSVSARQDDSSVAEFADTRSATPLLAITSGSSSGKGLARSVASAGISAELARSGTTHSQRPAVVSKVPFEPIVTSLSPIAIDGIPIGSRPSLSPAMHVASVDVRPSSSSLGSDKVGKKDDTPAALHSKGIELEHPSFQQESPSSLPPDLLAILQRQKEIEERLSKLDDDLPGDLGTSGLNLGDSASDVFSWVRPGTARTMSSSVFAGGGPVEEGEESGVLFGTHTQGGAHTPGGAMRALLGLSMGGRESPAADAGGADARMKLIYDPILKCYFDPVANKYYELRESTE